MNVGIGLPTAIPGTPPGLLTEWAVRADEGVYSSVGVVDRVRYDAFDPMTTLAFVASATQNVSLVTMVLIGPLRNNAALAKEAATVDAISGGRLTLGLAVGARHEDYRAIGVAHTDRGGRLSEQLADLRDFWERPETEHLIPGTPGPRLLVGGTSDMAFSRVARYADGYVMGGGPPNLFGRAADKARTAWSDLGRVGSPALWAQAYFTLGDRDEIDRGRAYMRDYYAFTGPFAERIARGMLDSPQAVAAFVRGYQEAGCDELVLLPALADIEQVDRLRDALTGV